MGNLKDEIAQAQTSLKIPDTLFRETPRDFIISIYRHAEGTFAKTLPTWWWMRLRSRGYAIAFRHDAPRIALSDFIHAKGQLYLMIEADEGLSSEARVVDTRLMYEGTLNSIEQIIMECSYFEYYLVAKSFRWLVCETHHGEYIAAGFRAIRWLKQYAKEHSEYIQYAHPLLVRSF